MTQRRLIVVVPALSGTLETWRPLLARLKQEPQLQGDTKWLEWEHRSGWWSTKRAESIALSLNAAIEAEWIKAGGFDEIVLMGHSLGGLLVRQAYLLGLGVDPTIAPRQEWSERVIRFVLLAAVNRGVNGINPSPERKWRRALLFLNWLFRVVWPLQRLLAYDVMRGSDFITNLRIQWMRTLSALEHPPTVVQLLGDRDGLVDREDSYDIEQFPTGWHVTVPQSSHRDIHHVVGEPGETRYALVRAALLDDAPLRGENRKVSGPDKIVFVLHGIRSSNNTWASDLKELIPQRDASVTVVLPTYKFFTALKFALPTTRRKHLQWFQDQYAEFLAKNPKAQFFFVGHSNGTYLFGQSLLAIPGMAFRRAVLVASVLPPEFEWNRAVQRGQLGSLCSVRSNRDIPVGVLCSALRGLGMKDVGPGGFLGFQYADPSIKEEVFWYDGGHSEALAREHLSHLVDYLFVQGGGRRARPQGVVNRQPPFPYPLLSRAAPWMARVIAVGAFAALGWLIFMGPENGFLAAMGLSAGFFVLFDLV